jgi:hypothetical protein
MPLDIDNFEVLDPLGVSTEGTTLSSNKSYVDVIFNAIPSRYSSLAIKFRENTMFPFTIYEQFQYLRYATGGQTNPTIYHAVKEGATKEQEAYNYYMALVGGGHVNDQGDLAKEGIKDLFTVSYVAGSNKVTITAVNDCVKFENWFTPPEVTLNIFNQDCTDSLPPLTATDIVSASGTPCSELTIELTTSELLVEILDPIEIIPNTANPVSFPIQRGVPTVFQGKDIYGRLLSKTYIGPPILDVGKFFLEITQGSNSATVVVRNTMSISTIYPLRFFYKLNDLLWTKGMTFTIALGGSHTMHIKDNYGCEISISFLISNFQDTSPTIIKKVFCGDLHELNVGKYLNLFGKQHTMKLGFVCNASAKDVKIFKHIQMLLNIEYSVKNINVKTSRGQERFVPGDHMNYRIREGQHSVPLKNPRDYDDLRGNWSYLEIEIESINNSKVDLFSVMMYLRKSTI